jgi:hypothetical protein
MQKLDLFYIAAIIIAVTSRGLLSLILWRLIIAEKVEERQKRPEKRWPTVRTTPNTHLVSLSAASASHLSAKREKKEQPCRGQEKKEIREQLAHGNSCVLKPCSCLSALLGIKIARVLHTGTTIYPYLSPARRKCLLVRV